MRDSKGLRWICDRGKEILKLAAGLLAISFLLYGINESGKFLYESARDNILLACAELEDSEGTIETVLLGTSLMHVGMDGQTLGEELDSTCFNLATSSQPVSGSYYLLEDVIKDNPVERVFFGIGVNTFVSSSENRDTSAKVRVMKMIQSYSGKLRFLMTSAEPKEWESLIFCTARTDDLLNLETIKQNVDYKLSDDFKNRIQHENARYDYYGMGSESTSKVFDGKIKGNKIPSNNIWSRDKIVEENVDDIRKMAALCEEKGIEFSIVVFPHAECFAEKQGDLADMDLFLEELCEEIGAGLYDYNMTARSDIYDTLQVEMFMDKKHLNHAGAVQFAKLLAKDYKNAQ